MNLLFCMTVATPPVRWVQFIGLLIFYVAALIGIVYFIARFNSGRPDWSTFARKLDDSGSQRLVRAQLRALPSCILPIAVLILRDIFQLFRELDLPGSQVFYSVGNYILIVSVFGIFFPAILINRPRILLLRAAKNDPSLLEELRGKRSRR